MTTPPFSQPGQGLGHDHGSSPQTTDPQTPDAQISDSQLSDPQAVPTCPRHTDSITYVRCQRCNRPTCTRCQRPAAVGVQCVDCVEAEAKTAPTIRSGLGFPAAPGRPIVSLSIIALCVLVWIGEMVSQTFYQQVSFIGVLAKSEPWRFITSGFAHDASSALPMHLAFNMYALYIVGQYLEPLLGRVRFAALFLLSVLGGSVAYLLLTRPPTSPLDAYTSGWVTDLVGASGGVFGLFLAVVALNRHLGRDINGMLTILAINVFIGFVVPNVAWQAHLGGAIVGGLVALALYALRRKPAAVQYGMLLGVAVALFALAYARYAMVDLSWIRVG